MSKEKRRFAVLHGELTQAYKCNIFPPELDFTDVCSCAECSDKIMELIKFQDEIKSTKKQVVDQLGKLPIAQDRGVMIATFIWRMIGVSRLLQNNLNAVVKNPGSSSTLKESYSCNILKDAYWKMMKKMKDVGVLPEIEIDPNKEVVNLNEEPFTDSIVDLMGDAIYMCEILQFEDGVPSTLNNILNSENELKDKSSETLQESLISLQLKELKKLSVMLEKAVDKAIDDVDIFMRQRDMLDRAQQYILSTCYDIIGKRNKFWQQYLNSKGEGNSSGLGGALDSLSQQSEFKVEKHDSSGLKGTLDSLREQVTLFKNQWKEKNYTQLFGKRKHGE